MSTQKQIGSSAEEFLRTPTTGEEKNVLFMKELALAVLLVISAAVCGWAFKRLLTTELASLLVWPPPARTYFLLAPLAFSVLFSLFIFLVGNFRVRALTLFLSAVALHALFSFQAYFLGSIILGWALMMLADQETKTELASSAKLYIRKAIGRNLGYFFTGVALMMSFIYYSTIPPNADAMGLFLPKPLFEGLIVSLQGPLQKVVPGIEVHATIDEFILSSLKTALKEGGQIVPDALLIEEIRKQRQAYAKNSGMALTGQEEFVDVLYITARKWAADHAGPYAVFIPAVLAVGYFLGLKGLSIVYYVVTMFITYLIIHFLLFLGLLKHYSVAVEKEVITL